MAAFTRLIQKIYKPLTVLLLFALIVIVIKRTGKKEDDGEVTYKSDQGAHQTVTVKASPCFMGELVMRVTATGLVKAAREAEILPQVSGTVVELPAQEGRRVAQGDLILRLNDQEARLDWLAAKDALSKAEDSFVEQLMSGGGSSAVTADDQEPEYLQRMDDLVKQMEAFRQNGDHELEAARLWRASAQNFAQESKEARWASRTGLTSAKLTEEKARLRLDQCRILAPFDGVLGEQEVCLGQRVGPGKAVFTLVDLSTVNVAAQCLESEVAHVRVGSAAEVRLAAFPGEVFHGAVTAINPLVDEKTRTCRVTVAVANPQGRIKAGMYAEAKLEAARYADRMLVPRSAVLERDNRSLVFIARDGLAKWCYVDLGMQNDAYFEVTGSAFDLKPDELVLTDGHYTLAHDSPIQIDNDE